MPERQPTETKKLLRHAALMDNFIYAAGVFVHKSPPLIREALGPIYDRYCLSFSPGTKTDLLLTYVRPPLPGLLARPLGEKEVEEATAIDELLAQTRLYLIITNDKFPDLPSIPPMLQGHSPLARRLEANSPTSYHLSYGLPPILHHNDKRQLIPYGIQPSFDLVTLNTLYGPKKRPHPHLSDLLNDKRPEPHAQKVHAELYRIFDQLINEPVPKREEPILDRLRFLGLQNEADFIAKTETALIQRMENKIRQLGGNPTSSIAKLRQFMAFSKASDKIRENSGAAEPPNGTWPGKRITGESCYCHSLASAWLLWTVIEGDITDLTTLEEAVEDTPLEFIHDLPEDLEIHTEEHYPPGNPRPTYTFTIRNLQQHNLAQADVTILGNGITLTHAQKVILNAITKDREQS